MPLDDKDIPDQIKELFGSLKKEPKARDSKLEALERQVKAMKELNAKMKKG